MPIIVTNTDNENDTPTRELESAFALGTAVVGGITYVIAGGISDNGVSVFRLDAGGTLTSVFDLADSAALHLTAPYHIESAIVGGSTYIYVSGFDSGFSALRVNADGSLTLVQDVTDTPATLLNWSYGSETVTVGGTTYLYVASYDEAGLTSYRVENSGALTFLGTVADAADPGHLLSGAARPHAVAVGGTTFLLVPGAGENGLNLFQVGADGGLTFVTAVGDSGALELGSAFHVASAVVGGVTYVYVCGYSDDGVSVFTLSAGGALANVQNITDSAGLLLNGPISLDVFQEGGGQYLSVTGQDYGVSLFQIGSDGLLTLDQSIADDATINLAFESHMVSAVVGGVTYLIGASSGDGGISAFRVGNTAPTLGANTGAAANEGGTVTITAAMLDYEDAEHADPAIAYTVTGATAGTVRLNGTALGTGGIFTQADVNNGLVSYAHDGSDTTSGSFGFTVSDGAGGSVSGQGFAIAVTPVNDAPAFAAPALIVTRASTASDGSPQATGGLSFAAPALSADGTKLLFSSSAANLVADDTNGVHDIFMKDLVTGVTTRVSTDAFGAQANGLSEDAIFSPDGTKILFTSTANNLTADDSGTSYDIFVKTLATGAIERVSRSSDGFTVTQGFDGIFSPDGTKVAFESGGFLLIRDLNTGVLSRFGTSGGAPFAALNVRFSPDGTKIVFESNRTDLVPNDTNGLSDVFVQDLGTGAITRVNLATDGSQSNAFSGFASFSPDGTRIVFASAGDALSASDANGTRDIFVRDLVALTTTLVSADASGVGGNATSQNSAGSYPVFSADGTTVYFDSASSNLVPGDTNGSIDIFAKNLESGTIVRLSTTSAGAQGFGQSWDVAISASGAITFRSGAQLAAADTDSFSDAYVLIPGNIPTASYTENGAPAQVAPFVDLTDDSADFAGATFTAAITAGSPAGDALSLASTGGSVGIHVVGNSVRYDNVEIGILTATATSLSVALDADATHAAVGALAEAVRIASSSEYPTNAIRTVTFTLVDGGGTDNGGQDTASFIRNVAFTPINDAPVVPDSPAVAVTEGSPATVNAALTVSDLDLDARNGGAGDYSGARFVMSRNGGANAQDQFIIGNANAVGFTVTGTILGGGDLQSGSQTFGNWNWDGTGTLTVNFTSAQTAATTTLVNAVLRTIQYNVASDTPPATVDLIYTLNDGAPGAGQGTGGSATDSGAVRMNIIATNNPPWLDLLNSGNPGAGTDVEIAYIENDGATLLAPNANVIDPDSPNFDGGRLTAGFGATGLAEDRLTIVDQGMGAGQIGVIGNAVFYGNVQIATFTGGTDGTTPLVVTFDADASPTAVIALVRKIAYTNVSDDPGTADRSIGINITDGGSGISNEATALVHVNAVEDLPIADNDIAATTEAATKNIAVLTNDTDLDGPAPAVAEIDGVSVVAGDTVTLASGATAKLENDGTITYDPNGKFNQLTTPGSGAVNTSAVDVFTYRLVGAVSTANVSVTVNGLVSSDERLLGDGEDNFITGTPQRDIFMVQQGGNDTILALAGNDTIYFGNEFTAADTVNGGDGIDSIILDGNYPDLVLGTGTDSNIVGIETISLVPAEFTDYDGSAAGSLDYYITTLDSNVAAGAILKVNGFYLAATEHFAFDGSAEQNGKFILLAGRGTDHLNGGAGNDIFVFGHDGRFGVNDLVAGEGGYDSLYLRGNYTIDFTEKERGGALSGIESVTLGGAADNQFTTGGGTEFDYSITWDDDLLDGGRITINASSLGSEESLAFNGSDEESAVFRLFGGGGNDVLTGGGGADFIHGGGRGDTLTGGGGNDVFAYYSVTESNSTERDGIQVFDLGDLIDLSRIDADTGAAGDQAFVFIGEAEFSGQAGELRFLNISLGGPVWEVEGDTNGDKVSDFEVVLVIIPADPITMTDFIL